jgi:hypothetical protein
MELNVGLKILKFSLECRKGAESRIKYAMKLLEKKEKAIINELKM